METLLILVAIFSFLGFIFSTLAFLSARKNAAAVRTVGHVMSKIRTDLKSRGDGAALHQNAEIIYSDMLRNIAPIAAAIGTTPRDTNEHPLWQTLGGIMDAYSANPYVLEQLRRELKNNTDAQTRADLFLARAEQLLAHLTEIDANGILTMTFTDGLLGQAMTLITSAKQLANEKEEGRGKKDEKCQV
ncbi:MAG: hypothetical protein LBR41_02580 [Rickettsiales bacterium]|jgi:uncharacterized membrane protein YdfJ with MMPL/SSD domain|nr:hypothetical protein [Rickettsiales bacterium]